MINMTQWARDLMSKQERVAIPIMTHPGIELCNYRVVDAVTNGKIHFQAVKKLYELYPSAAATVIMDLTVEAEAFGAEITFPENEVPSVIGNLVTTMEDVENLHIPDMAQGRLSEYLLVNSLSVAAIQDKPVLAGCIGPYSLAGRLMGMTEIMTGIYTDPDMVMLLLEKCNVFLLNYCKEIKKTGVGGVVIAEPAAGLISAEDCSIYSSAFIRKIVEELQDDTFMVVLHNCGNTGHCTSAMVETGAAALHFGNRIDMLDALEDCPEDVLVMGNIDPVGCMKMGTPEGVYFYTMQLLNKTSGYRNFVLSTGCDVPPHVSPQNIRAFYRALQEYNLHLKS